MEYIKLFFIVCIFIAVFWVITIVIEIIKRKQNK